MFCKAVSGSHATMTDILDFISNTADGVVGVDRGQKVVLWNPAAEMLLGFKRREVLGRFCCEVIGGRDGSGASVCYMGCPDLVMARKQEADLYSRPHGTDQARPRDLGQCQHRLGPIQVEGSVRPGPPVP